MQANNIIPSALGVMKQDHMFAQLGQQLAQYANPIPLTQFNNHPTQNYNQEYNLVNQLYYTDFWDDQKIKLPSQISKTLNRYSDIKPYSFNCVSLKDKSKDLIDSYINADYIMNIYDTNKQSSAEFIATQGPIENTYSHFWRMVWQEKVENIVMLCGISEEGRPMCDVYWPEKVGSVLVYDNMVVK